MKKKILLISSFLLSLSGSLMAQYFDDIYYNPKQENTTEIKTTPQKETVVIYNNNVRDVDEYNRQVPSSNQQVTSASQNTAQGEYEYTNRITRFHNPEAVTINNPENVYVYNNTESEPESTVNLHVSRSWNPWGYNYSSRYYPSSRWNSWDSYYGWNTSFYSSYYPFYTNYPSPYYHGYYSPAYSYGYYGNPYYYGYNPYYYHSNYYHRPIYTTRSNGYKNNRRTPNYTNDGRGRASVYSTTNSGQRSTRSVSPNTDINRSTNTRNTGTYDTRGRSYNGSSQTNNTYDTNRSTRSTTNTSTERTLTPVVKESNSGRSFNSSSTPSTSSDGGTRSSRSNDSTPSNTSTRSSGGRSFNNR